MRSKFVIKFKINYFILCKKIPRSIFNFDMADKIKNPGEILVKMAFLRVVKSL